MPERTARGACTRSRRGSRGSAPCSTCWATSTTPQGPMTEPDRTPDHAAPDASRPDDDTPAQQLEQAILGEDAVFNALDVAAETGASIEEARRLWRARGVPD